MKSAPLILIVPGGQNRGEEFSDSSISLSNRYTSTLTAAGALPWVMPLTIEQELIAECLRRTDGVMLTGGGDADPKLFSSRNPSPALRRTLGSVDRARDLMELLVIEEVFRQRKPLLAICRGLQMLNVALGGTLLIDIPQQRPDALNHSRSDRKNEVVHEVALTPHCLLAKTFAVEKLGVNSSHHQAAGRVARPLRVTARSEDGIIEALELADERVLPYLLAVQFHPERLVERYPAFRRLFSGFAQACSRFKK